LLKLANTVLILINPSPSNIKDNINIGRYSTEKVSMRILYSKRLVVYSRTL